MNTATRMFVDNFNRTVIFHGVNVVVKQPPYIPITSYFDPQMSLCQEDIENLINWGFNFVRLGVMWESVEIQPGVYNYTYLRAMGDLITTLGENGIWTLVDAHQDAFARRICGEGIPDFYASNLTDKCSGLFGSFLEDIKECVPFSTFNYSKDSNGDPIIQDCLNVSFVEYFKTPEAGDGYSRIYKNKYGLQDRFADFWNVTSWFFSNNSYVVGYDILNEPLQADMVTAPWVKIPGVNDFINLQPLYQRFNNVIRTNDESKIIFFEPIQADLLPYLGGMVFPIGLTDTPGGAAYNNRQVLNDHSYCCQGGKEICAKGEPASQYLELCKELNYARVTSRAIDAQNLNVGLIITEFGACFDSENCVNEITAVTDACDKNLAGWAYWMFKGFGDFTTTGNLQEGFYNNATLQAGKVKALARTYVPYYQGTPFSINFNSTNGFFETEFLLDPNCHMPTVVFASNDIYYNATGFHIVVVNSLQLEYTMTQVGTNYYEILLSQPQLSNTTISVVPGINKIR